MMEFDHSLLPAGIRRWMGLIILSGGRVDVWHRPRTDPIFTFVCPPMRFRGFPDKWVLGGFTWQSVNGVTRISVGNEKTGEAWGLKFLHYGAPVIDEGTMSLSRMRRSIEVLEIAGTLRSALENEFREETR